MELTCLLSRFGKAESLQEDFSEYIQMTRFPTFFIFLSPWGTKIKSDINILETALQT
jgi:hypothetical protein